MKMSLQKKLYKEILLKKKELEEYRKKGGDAHTESDLPCMAAGCEYAGVQKCGFSSHSKHISRPDIHYPFDTLLHDALMQQAPDVPKLPFVVFSKKRIPVAYANGAIKYKRVVKKFVGTCAEDNASNSVLYELPKRQRPESLKQLTFTHPLRTRTLEREKMCVVCKSIFTEP